MKCARCGSENVSITVTNEAHMKDAHHGCCWWLFVGWWWIPVKWICLTVPAILAKIFIPKKQTIKNKTQRVAVCQNCGYTWKI